MIYMRQPEGYIDGTERVCKLNRSLGLQATSADPCVFTNGRKGDQLILAIHIDDGLIAAESELTISNLLQELSKEFSITSSNAGTYLGLQIERLADGSIFVHQEAYAKRILNRFRMEEANAVAVPADPHHQMNADMHLNGDKEASNAPYRQVIGSLMYLSVATRPDITFSVNSASQYLEKPMKVHWNAAKRILKYIKGTSNYGLHFPSRQENHLHVYSDADFAGDTTTRRSTTGLVVKLGDSTVSWNSIKQRVVALSTTEAEYMAGSQAVREIVWVKGLLRELGLFELEELKTTLKIDNLSAIKLIKNPEYHKRSKHIDVRYYFIREKYENKEFSLEHVSSQDQ